MKPLYFENSYGDRRVIAYCENSMEVNKAIRNFINQCNEHKPLNKQFKSYYTRLWEEDGMMKIDVGSHTEFFLAPLEFYHIEGDKKC